MKLVAFFKWPEARRQTGEGTQVFMTAIMPFVAHQEIQDSIVSVCVCVSFACASGRKRGGGKVGSRQE